MLFSSDQLLTRIAIILLLVCGIGKFHAMCIAFAYRLIHAVSNRTDLVAFYERFALLVQILIFIVPVFTIVVSFKKIQSTPKVAYCPIYHKVFCPEL
jgi:hypothetical protein